MVRACRSVGLSKSAYYEPPIDWVSRDRDLIEALRSLADSHPRRGFWKYYKMLRRTGRTWNHKRLYRVYCAMKLNHRRRAKQRVPVREPQPLWVPDRANIVWSADFMSDALYHGRRFRTFNVIDDHNREAVAIEIDSSITAPRVIRVFEQLKSWRGLHRPHDSLGDLTPIEYAETPRSSSSQWSASRGRLRLDLARLLICMPD